jgi:Coenzyme PQQ synthesis protein D (PqqD)
MVAARELDGEMVIMSAVDSTLFTLDDVATAIWKAVDGVTPLHDVIEQRLRAQYDVALDIAVADVESFVEELAGRGILLISDEPILFPVRKS